MIFIVVLMLSASLMASESFNFLGLPKPMQQEVFYHIATQDRALARRDSDNFKQASRACYELKKTFFAIKPEIKKELCRVAKDEWITSKLLFAKNPSIKIEDKKKRKNDLKKYRHQRPYTDQYIKELNGDIDDMNELKIFYKDQDEYQEVSRLKLLKNSFYQACKSLKEEIIYFPLAVAGFSGISAILGLGYGYLMNYLLGGNLPLDCSLGAAIWGTLGPISFVAGIKLGEKDEEIRNINIKNAFHHRIQFIKQYQKNGFLSLPKDYQMPRISENVLKAGLFWGWWHLRNDYNAVWGKK